MHSPISKIAFIFNNVEWSLVQGVENIGFDDQNSSYEIGFDKDKWSF